MKGPQRSSTRTTPIADRSLALLAVALLVGLLSVDCAVIPFGTDGAPRPTVPARVAYTAEDGHAYTVSLAGGDTNRVSQVNHQVAGETIGREAPVPRWPTWAPDASRLAFVRVLVASAETLVAAQLWTVAHDGTDPRKVWEASDQEPIYLAWSPDGASIAMLVQGEDDLSLVVVDARGSQPSRQIAKGNPFYFCWAPDSRALLLHIGSTQAGASQPEIAIARLGPPDEVRSLGLPPGEFRTPGWTSDGRKLAFVTKGPDGVSTISLVSPEGGDITRVATPPAPSAFMLAPDGSRLAWGSRAEQDRLAYDGLEVATTDGRTRTQVTKDLVVAWFWSPDSRQLAFVTLERGGQTFVWHVADASGANARRLSGFMPTPGEIRIMAFFDQYAISHGPWAPDSSALVYAVGLPGELPGAGLSGPGVIQAVAADGKSQARTVIGGNFVAMPVPAP